MGYEHRNGIRGAYRTLKKSASNVWRYYVLRDDSVYASIGDSNE